MAKTRRIWRNRPDKFRGGRVIVNKKDFNREDYISPGKLVAWAEWVPNRPKKKMGRVSGNV